jgi:hypothetical protein
MGDNLSADGPVRLIAILTLLAKSIIFYLLEAFSDEPA